MPLVGGAHKRSYDELDKSLFQLIGLVSFDQNGTRLLWNKARKAFFGLGACHLQASSGSSIALQGFLRPLRAALRCNIIDPIHVSFIQPDRPLILILTSKDAVSNNYARWES